MARGNISVFIPHIGCPNICSFCDQHRISGSAAAPSPDEAEEIIRAASDRMPAEDRARSEIAFFGGSFTAIPRDYMEALLSRAEKYLMKSRADGFRGIRLSTRPDCIDDEILGLLKGYGVTAIELGAQSMCDRVLEMNRRGHTAEDAVRSAALIKKYGFEMGLQIMAGLYGSSPEDDIYTMRRAAECSPDTVRIYPTVILRGTYLAELYERGEYVPYPFEKCVEVCAEMLQYFAARDIRVIRLGLHAEETIENNRIGGYYHPAFAELVRSELFRRAEEKLFAECDDIPVIYVSPRDVSCALGHKRSNVKYFDGKGIDLNVKQDPSIVAGSISGGGRTIDIYEKNLS